MSLEIILGGLGVLILLTLFMVILSMKVLGKDPTNKCRICEKADDKLKAD